MTPEERNRAIQIKALNTELSKANEALKNKALELDKRIRDEQPRLFEDSSILFEQPINPSSKKVILEPYKARIIKLEQEIERLSKAQLNETGRLF